MWTVSSPAQHPSHSPTSNVWLPHSDHPAGPILFPRRACGSVGQRASPARGSNPGACPFAGMLGVPRFGRSEILLRWTERDAFAQNRSARSHTRDPTAQECLGLDDDRAVMPLQPSTREQDPKQTIPEAKAGATSSAAPVNTRNTDAETGCRVRTIRSEAKCRYPPRRDTASWASRLPVAATRPRAPAEREDRKGAE